jgi:hypothetical protein
VTPRSCRSVPLFVVEVFSRGSWHVVTDPHESKELVRASMVRMQKGTTGTRFRVRRYGFGLALGAPWPDEKRARRDGG